MMKIPGPDFLGRLAAEKAGAKQQYYIINIDLLLHHLTV